MQLEVRPEVLKVVIVGQLWRRRGESGGGGGGGGG